MDSWVHKNNTGKTSRRCCNGFCHLQTVLLSMHVSLQDMHTPPRLHLPACLCKWLPTQGSLENILLLRAPSMALALLCTCTCLAMTFSQTSLHLQRLSCSYCPFTLPQEEQDGSHPWGRNLLSHHTTSQAGVFQSEESGCHCHPHSHPTSQEPVEDEIKHYTYFFFPPRLKEEQLLEASQVPSRAFSGWCFVQVELQWETEHEECRQGDCCGQHRWARRTRADIGPLLLCWLPAGLALCCYIDRWREGWFSRGCSVKGGYWIICFLIIFNPVQL